MLYAGLAALGAAIAALIGNWIILRAALKPPRTPLFLTPLDLDLPYIDVRFGKEIELAGWWIPADNAVGTVVLCHGYFMNRSEPLVVAKRLWPLGFNCLTFDFRACGKSGGDLCSLGYHESNDVTAAVDEAERRTPGLPIIAFGASMGAVASNFAASRDRRIAAIVADSPYARLSDAVDDWWKGSVGPLAMWLLKPAKLVGILMTKVSPYSVRPDMAVQAIDRPILLLHGERDRLIPAHHSRRIYAVANEPKEALFFEQSDHVQARFDHPERYYQALTSFVQSVVKREAGCEV